MRPAFGRVVGGSAVKSAEAWDVPLAELLKAWRFPRELTAHFDSLDSQPFHQNLVDDDRPLAGELFRHCEPE